MRFIAAIICLSIATAASAGNVRLYTPAAVYDITGTSYVSTVATVGHFTILDAAVTQLPGNGAGMKPMGYENYTGGINTPCGGSVTFQGCTLMQSNFGEQGLLNYEVYCDTQTGNF